MAPHASGSSDITPKITYNCIQLSISVSLYRPNEVSGAVERSAKSPKLILLATWMDARNEHIGKYVVRYQELHPNACIVVVKSFFKYYFSPTAARQDLLPAAHVIRDVLELDDLDCNNDTPNMLIHIFSNGGSCMLYHLYDVYAETYHGSLIPQHVTIFDSVPGRWSYSGGTGALLVGLPTGWVRLLTLPLVHLLGLWWFIKYRVLKIPEESFVWGRAHNDASRVRETCRVYIYSEDDIFVHFSAVEENADHAEANGFVVEREKFPNSSHVAHARSDPDRYWAISKDIWGSALKSIEGTV